MIIKRKWLTVLVLLSFALCSVAHAASFDIYSDPGAVSAGGTATLYLNVQNDGAAAMEHISINNDYGVSFDTAGVSIQPGEAHLFSKRITVPEGLLGQPLSFEVEWQENQGGAYVNDSDTLTLTIAPGAGGAGGAGVAVDRTVNAAQAAPGQTIILTYTVTNNNSYPITGLSITDKGISSSPLVSKVTVEPYAVYTYTHEFKMGYATVVSTPVIDYTDSMTKSKDSLSVKEMVLGMINNKLTVEVEQGANSADGVTFTLYLTNNGNQKLSKIQIKDELGNHVNSDSISLAIGESATVKHTVQTDSVRNVVFYLTGVSATGDSYEDKTKTYVVRKYVDPSQLGLSFNAAITQTLNASGSIGVRLTINNTGSMTMQDLVISEQEVGEIRRQDSLAPGEFVMDETLYVGSPRDMVFTLSICDEAGNPYTYTANITASFLGEPQQSAPPVSENMIDEIQALGGSIGGAISRALSIALIVLTVLCCLCVAALVALYILERKQRRERAYRRMMREQQQGRPQRSGAPIEVAQGGYTEVVRRGGAPLTDRPSLEPRQRGTQESYRRPPASPASRTQADPYPVREARGETQRPRERENLEHTIITRNRPKE